jgi:hypothetical protein
MKLVRYAERPDLRARRHAELSGATFPEYMHHSESGNRYWGRLYSDFPAFQVALSRVTSSSRKRMQCRCLGTAVEGLPSGWEGGFVRGMTSTDAPTTLMAIAISVAPARQGHRQGQRLSGRVLETFKHNARAPGFPPWSRPCGPR